MGGSEKVKEVRDELFLEEEEGKSEGGDRQESCSAAMSLAAAKLVSKMFGLPFVYLPLILVGPDPQRTRKSRDLPSFVGGGGQVGSPANTHSILMSKYKQLLNRT